MVLVSQERRERGGVQVPHGRPGDVDSRPDHRSVPLLASLALGTAFSLLAGLIWEFGVIPCGWPSLVASSGQCTAHHLVLLPLLALLGGPIGAVVAAWRQKWSPLVLGILLALVSAFLTAVVIWS
jgi:hypothetical protein